MPCHFKLHLLKCMFYCFFKDAKFPCVISVSPYRDCKRRHTFYPAQKTGVSPNHCCHIRAVQALTSCPMVTLGVRQCTRGMLINRRNQLGPIATRVQSAQSADWRALHTAVDPTQAWSSRICGSSHGRSGSRSKACWPALTCIRAIWRKMHKGAKRQGNGMDCR